MNTPNLHKRGILLALLMLLTPGALFAQSQFNFHGRRMPRQRPRHPIQITKPGTGAFGAPLPGLTVEQLADFAEGLDEFESEDTAASGLGPCFNNVSCAACHSVPAIGGSSTLFVTRFGRLMHGNFDPLPGQGGSLLQEFAIVPECQEVIPTNANVTARRQTTPLFGLGLIEAIPDKTILQNANCRQPDGISGHAAVIEDIASGEMRVGRFGWKAQQATLLSFSGDAYVNEMGITSRLFPEENSPNGYTNLSGLYDLVPDPEDETDPVTGKSDIDRFTDFMRFLAPPPTLRLTDSGRTGQTLFTQIGCANCHLPTMQTGPNSVKALDRKTVVLYSDLLLHDMGSLNDGIGQADAAPNEMKTAPLWGLRASGPYLHDGRAATVDKAIRAHDGEAARAQARYLKLPADQRQHLLDFLNTL